MQIVTEIPDYIIDILTNTPNIGRRDLSANFNISESLARYYIKLWNERKEDTSSKSIGLKHLLQDKVSKQAEEIKKLQSELAKEDLVLDRLKSIIPELKLSNKIDKLKFSNKAYKEEREALVTFADWHAGSVVNLQEMEGINEYNMSIMAGRVWDLITGLVKIVETQRASFKIDTLNIFALGDIVSGDIHRELLVTNEEAIMQIVLETAYIMSQAIVFLTNHFNFIKVNCCAGNHGRTTQKPEFKKRVINNYDTLIYQITSLFLAKYIKEGIIQFKIPKSYEHIELIKGWSFLLGHGDSIKSWSGFPSYGMFRDNSNQQKIRKGKSLSNQDEIKGFDFRVMGHWHNFMVADSGTTLVSPCLCGTDEYALNKMHVSSQPAQLLAFISERWGIKTVEQLFVRDRGHEFNIYKDGPIGECN